MKLSLLLILIVSVNSCAQTNTYNGEYYLNRDGSGMDHHYKLTLNSDGTFEFLQHWNQENRPFGQPNKTESTGVEKGRGKWTFANQMILFTRNIESEKSLDYRLDFDSTKARVLIDSSLIFVESKMFWLQNIELKKK